MTTNVQQEKVQLHIDLEKLGPLASFKVAIAILRRQFTWLFMLSWSAILLAFIPSFDQGGVMTREIFLRNWGSFLPFSHLWMNIFLACWILTVFTGIFMNKYDSSFNMLTSNISSVLTLWTGWVPALMPGTIVLSLIAIWPSYKYSLHMRDIMARHFGTPDEHVGLIQKS